MNHPQGQGPAASAVTGPRTASAGDAPSPAFLSNRRPAVVLAGLVVAMTGSAGLLKATLPVNGMGRVPHAARAADPTSTEAIDALESLGSGGGRATSDGPAAAGAQAAAVCDRNWGRIEVHLAGPDGRPADIAPAPETVAADPAAGSATDGASETLESVVHFVIRPGAGPASAVTSVRPLWRSRSRSPLDDAPVSPRAGDAVYIAMVEPFDGGGPTPGQWQALGLLVRQLRERYGVGRVQFDDRLREDPASRRLQVAASW
jgi:hypothetical protein